MEILTIESKEKEKFLRTKAKDFDFLKYSKKEIKELIAEMKKTMREADGIGLAGNQIGINARIFVAEIPGNQKSRGKFYAIFNPKIAKSDGEETDFEEGCLSVPKTFGKVKRPTNVVLEGMDANGKDIKIKAWGLLARIFQHEMDHLNGSLFIDKAKEIHKIESRIQNQE
ncbi:MAG: peptide deformylase [Candidatus Pacebacteria bacterium]|nr:peptide deformylase [Candidatus Paceibacterota bacterium]